MFIKSELKVGVIYVKENQYTEEEILDNNENSAMFDEFLQGMGDKVRLRGKNRKSTGSIIHYTEISTKSETNLARF